MDGKPRNILVRPCYPDYLKNWLFDPEHTPHWLHPLGTLKQKALQRGWQMDTWDMAPLASADVILFQDLPARNELEEARKKAPNAKLILYIWETPLARPQAWNPVNHALFDAVLTYDRSLVDQKRYFYCPVPSAEQPGDIPDLPFADRKPLVMVNSSRWLGLWGHRQPGLAGLPFFGIFFTGWNVTTLSVLQQTRGEQYTHRIRLARLADSEFPGVLEVFGYGWTGESVSWIHKFVRHRPFACGHSKFDSSKYLLIANYRFAISFENMVGNRGYVSEKIFDTLYAGVVPIYLGDERITDVVPPDCFIDARQFKGDDRKLLEFVASCDEAAWKRYREAGKNFLASPAMDAVKPEAFCRSVLSAIDAVMLPGETTGKA